MDKYRWEINRQMTGTTDIWMKKRDELIANYVWIMTEVMI